MYLEIKALGELAKKKGNLRAEALQWFLTYSFNLSLAHVSCNQRQISTAIGIAVELESSAWGEKGHTNGAEADDTV